jgi:phospholipid/cholesterol/gamma-HCH transport system substrate-binding protein
MNEQNSRRRQVAVGVFIFLGLVILVIGIFTIGSQHKTFVKSIPLMAIFDDVQGLQPGNNIWLSGMKVGTVKRVAFYGSSQVEVTMNIEKLAQTHIRKDARVRIGTDGLVGNKIVVIYGGSDSAGTVIGNDRLQTEHRAGTEELMATLQANNNNLLEITGNLKEVSKKLTTGQGTLGQLINDPALGNNLRASISHLQAASANSERVIANLGDFTSGLHRPGVLANELVTDTVVFQNLKSTVEKLNDAAAAASEFTQTMKTAGAGISNGLNDKNAPLGMLLHDEDAAADLQRTIKNLRVSSKELSDDLEAVQHNFLLRRFFRKRSKE